MRCGTYYQFCSYWHCQKCCLMIFIFLIFKFTWIGLNLGGLRRNRREKMCLQPFRFRDILNRDLRVYSQRNSSEKV